MKVYQSNAIIEVEQFYGSLLQEGKHGENIRTHLIKLADKLWEGIQAKTPVVRFQISNYHSQYLGIDLPTLWQQDLAYADATYTIAKEHSFDNWEQVEQLEEICYDADFEMAISFLLSGEFSLLKSHLKTHPDLIHQRSKYGHQATLLHYVSSNGVELWRQKVPLNLPELTRLLLASGADKKATMKVYGGEYNTLTLLETSAHPFDAGIGKEMINVLND